MPIDKPFLYEIKKDSRQGYLFGTIHTGVMAQDLPDFFWNYFTAAESFAGESNFDEEIRKEILEVFKTKAIKESSDPLLSARLSSNDFQSLQTIIRQKYTTLKVENLSPFGAYYFLLHTLNPKSEVLVTESEAQRIESKNILDQELMKKAVEQNKIMTFLDEGLMSSTLDCIVSQNEFYLQSIHMALNDAGYMKAQTQKTIDLIHQYQSGDEKQLKLTLESENSMKECLFERRNKAWMNNILINLENFDKSMIAVGAGHLFVGKNNLIKLLQDQGYSVRRIEK